MCTSYRFPFVVLLITVSSWTDLAVKLTFQHRSQVAYQYPAINQRMCSCEQRVFPSEHAKKQSCCLSKLCSTFSMELLVSSECSWYPSTWAAHHKKWIYHWRLQARQTLSQPKLDIFKCPWTVNSENGFIWNLEHSGTALGCHPKICNWVLSVDFFPWDFPSVSTKSPMSQEQVHPR